MRWRTEAQLRIEEKHILSATKETAELMRSRIEQSRRIAASKKILSKKVKTKK